MAYMIQVSVRVHTGVRAHTRITQKGNNVNMKESDLEKYLVREIKKLGGRAYKWTSPGNDGVPDRIVILPHKLPVFVELKTETGKLSAIQTVQIKRLLDLGQYVRVLYGIEEVNQFLSRCVGDTDGV